MGQAGPTGPTGLTGHMDHRAILAILDDVPPFRPRILEIARDLTEPNGNIEHEAAMLRTEEIERALLETQNYVLAVRKLRAAVSCRI